MERPLSDEPSPGWHFVAFIRSSDHRSQMALYNLKRICANYLNATYRIEVVEFSEQPERARREDVIALPTVIRKRPEPESRIVGDLSDTGSVLRALNIHFEEAGHDRWTANIGEQVKMLHYSIIRLAESFLNMFGNATSETEQQERMFRGIIRSTSRHLEFERSLQGIRDVRPDEDSREDVEDFRRTLSEMNRKIEQGEATRVEVVSYIRDWFLKKFRTPGTPGYGGAPDD